MLGGISWDFTVSVHSLIPFLPGVLCILLILLKSWCLPLSQREVHIGGRTRPDCVLTLGLGVKPFPKHESLTTDVISE